jgi:hypothetical protein
MQSEKIMRCTQCGTESKQVTNHTGPTWSWGRYNCCPNCPPHQKYPEFGGSTTWEYVSTVVPVEDELTEEQAASLDAALAKPPVQVKCRELPSRKQKNDSRIPTDRDD